MEKKSSAATLVFINWAALWPEPVATASCPWKRRSQRFRIWPINQMEKPILSTHCNGLTLSRKNNQNLLSPHCALGREEVKDFISGLFDRKQDHRRWRYHRRLSKSMLQLKFLLDHQRLGDHQILLDQRPYYPKMAFS